MDFRIIRELGGVETIAEGREIRDVRRLQKTYGTGRWRKLKRIALIQLPGGEIRRAELHWYEAHGIGPKELKWKRYVD